jgi:hypothetical protein
MLGQAWGALEFDREGGAVVGSFSTGTPPRSVIAVRIRN